MEDIIGYVFAFWSEKSSANSPLAALPPPPPPPPLPLPLLLLIIHAAATAAAAFFSIQYSLTAQQPKCAS
jgi:hypothetical protein